MSNYITFFLIFCTAFTSCAKMQKSDDNPLKKIESVNFSNIQINDDFWTPRLKKHASTTLAVCIDQIENKTGRIRNFENAAKDEGEHSGIYYDDSDVYKALEGIAYTLINHPDPNLEAKADEWIDKFAAAQEADGYLNTYYSLTGLENRWQNMWRHEMYCAGHMIEAAVAYYQATGKTKFLDIAIRKVEHMMDIFGPNKKHWVTGHQEIELALVRLYEETGDERYLDFSTWLIEERGHGHGRGKDNSDWNPEYCQDDLPVREMTDIAGHAVRAMYLYCGMADNAALNKDTGYIQALDRLWDDVVFRKMYITGGIGSSRHNEGFTEPFDLPNYDAYCETCASIGMVYWNSRMNQLKGDAKYIDVLERSLYNAALAGISLEGDRFFYVNPLASRGDHHRKEWYGTACCPSQISRFLPSIGNYIYGVSNDALWLNLYIGNEAKINIDNNEIVVKQETNYPWQGSVSLTILSTSSPINKEIRLRIPEWCESFSLLLNGETITPPELKNGYISLLNEWKTGDNIEILFEMPVRIIASDPRVKENIGKRAIQRGPLIYCIEEVDNKENFNEISLSSFTTFTPKHNPLLLNGVTEITASTENEEVILIPYYAWDNRESGEMKVWIDYLE